MIAPLAGGGFVVVWQDASGEGGDSDTSVKAQLFDAAGNKIGGEFLVNTATTDVQTSPSVAALENGGFALCGLNDQVRRLLELSGLSNSLSIHPSREEALAALGG